MLEQALHRLPADALALEHVVDHEAPEEVVAIFPWLLAEVLVGEGAVEGRAEADVGAGDRGQVAERGEGDVGDADVAEPLELTEGAVGAVAEAAPVEVGTMLTAAARARRRSLWGPSTSAWSPV